MTTDYTLYTDGQLIEEMTRRGLEDHLVVCRDTFCPGPYLANFDAIVALLREDDENWAHSA